MRDGVYWFDAAAADRACLFFPAFLTHLKGEWARQPLRLDAWQERDLIRPLFGWKRHDGTRRYRRCDCWIPRKNGKSTLAAGVALYLTWADGEPGAEVYGAASDREQAKLVFRDAAAMARASEDLMAELQVFRSSIVCPDTLSAYSVLSSESENKDGLNIHGLVWDEFHEAADQDLFDKLTTASAARRQPLMLVISTAGHDQTSLAYREYLRDRRILDGLACADDRLVVIYEAGPKDDWRSEATWAKANPGWGSSVKPDYLRAQYAEARADPAREAAFKRYHLNIWTSQVTGWMDMDAWDRCGGPIDVSAFEVRAPESQEIGPSDPRSEPDDEARPADPRPAAAMPPPCWIGLDLSRRDDLTAAVALWRVPDQEQPNDPDRDTVSVLARCFMPDEHLDAREARDDVPYKRWAQEGHIDLTPGNVIDYARVRSVVLEWARRFRVQEVAYDPYSATQLALQLADDGLTVVEYAQSIRTLTQPTKELRSLVLRRRFRHGDNPVLRWMAENCRVLTDSNDNQKVSKKGQRTRIDAIAATINALGRSMVRHAGPSVYETDGVTVL
ncbi:MAG: terminase large subunit [Phycisphaerales bacterium]